MPCIGPCWDTFKFYSRLMLIFHVRSPSFFLIACMCDCVCVYRSVCMSLRGHLSAFVRSAVCPSSREFERASVAPSLLKAFSRCDEEGGRVLDWELLGGRSLENRSKMRAIGIEAAEYSKNHRRKTWAKKNKQTNHSSRHSQPRVSSKWWNRCTIKSNEKQTRY